MIKILVSIVLGFTSCSYLLAQKDFSITLFDNVRNRVIPLTIYPPKKETPKTKVVIFNHGYDQNKNKDSNKEYSYLTRFLAKKGFYVISIQHELSTDPLLAMEGNFMETRMPNWQRGKNNILFTINEYKKIKPLLDWDKLIIIGHSNGGDMSILFASEYPDLVDKVVSLDHRRMVIPRTKKPFVLTLRGSDYEADPDVLPTKEEEQRYGIKVIQLSDINHSDMSDFGTKKQHDTIIEYVYNFIK